MNPFTAFVTYLVIWWLVFLAALPFGVRGQWEDGKIAHGSEPGAPVNPMLLKKVLWTSVIAAVLFGIVFAIITSGIITLDMMPGPGSYWE